MLPCPRPVLFREAPEERPLEQSSLERSRSQSEFAHDRPEPIAKPPIHGNRKAHLPSRQNFTWHEIPQRGPQHRLRLPATQLAAARDRRGALDELMIQIR